MNFFDNVKDEDKPMSTNITYGADNWRDSTVTEVAQRMNEALDRRDAAIAKPVKEDPIRSGGLGTLMNAALKAERELLKSKVAKQPKVDALRVTHQGVEWARISTDGTIAKLDLNMARELVKQATFTADRTVSISDVIACLVVEAYACGKRDAAPAPHPQRVRDL